MTAQKNTAGFDFDRDGRLILKVKNGSDENSLKTYVVAQVGSYPFTLPTLHVRNPNSQETPAGDRAVQINVHGITEGCRLVFNFAGQPPNKYYTTNPIAVVITSTGDRIEILSHTMNRENVSALSLTTPYPTASKRNAPALTQYQTVSSLNP